MRRPDGGWWTADGGRRAVDSGRWTVDGGRRTVDGERTADSVPMCEHGMPCVPCVHYALCSVQLHYALCSSGCSQSFVRQPIMTQLLKDSSMTPWVCLIATTSPVNCGGIQDRINALNGSHVTVQMSMLIGLAMLTSPLLQHVLRSDGDMINWTADQQSAAAVRVQVTTNHLHWRVAADGRPWDRRPIAVLCSGVQRWMTL